MGVGYDYGLIMIEEGLLGDFCCWFWIVFVIIVVIVVV